MLRESPVLRFTSGSLRIVCIVVTPLWKLIMHTAVRRFSQLNDKIQRIVAQIQAFAELTGLFIRMLTQGGWLTYTVLCSECELRSIRRRPAWEFSIEMRVFSFSNRKLGPIFHSQHLLLMSSPTSTIRRSRFRNFN